MRAAALGLLVLLACGRSGEAPSAAPSAGQIRLELTVTDAESSKDSHEQVEDFLVEGGQLVWRVLFSGYREEKSPPEGGQVALTEAELGRIIDLCRAGHLGTDASEDGGQLSGPGSLLTFSATVAVDGETGKSSVRLPRPWNGPKVEPGVRQRALEVLQVELAAIRDRDRTKK